MELVMLVDNLAVGDYTVNIYYPGSDIYYNDIYENYFIVNPMAVNFTIIAGNHVYGDDYNVTISSNDNLNHTVFVTINNQSGFIKLINGSYVFNNVMAPCRCL